MPRLLLLALAGCLTLTPVGFALSVDDRAEAGRETEPAALSGTWAASGDQPFAGTLRGVVTVPADAGTSARIRLENARFTAVPSGCLPSSIRRQRTWVTPDGTTVTCRLPAGGDRVVEFHAVAIGGPDAEIGGTVRAGGAETDLPTLPAPATPAALSPRLRLLSSPDFLNADVGDLARGPGFWNPRRSANGINRDYRRALDGVLDDWAATDPDGVLVAGDLVNGRWGYDDKRAGNFGRVRTLPQRLAALDRAAQTYFPQWRQRFDRHRLDVFPAMGDHEYGDNPWPADKRVLATRFRDRFADQFTRDRRGRAVFADRPRGMHEFTAYAGRPLPDVQLITLDVFDITRKKARLGLDAEQRDWLRGVLQKAQRDRVRWIVVQGHVPILGPVRTRGSSNLSLPDREDSWVWRTFEKYGVDLYLSGEAHDVTVLEHGGVSQVTHGGMFQFGLTNAVLLDFYDDFVYLTLRDYDLRHRDAADGSRLWETRKRGLPKQLELRGAPYTIGTAVLPDAGGLRLESGLLVPWH
jgi:hypothetical protein